MEGLGVILDPESVGIFDGLDVRHEDKKNEDQFLKFWLQQLNGLGYV